MTYLKKLVLSLLFVGVIGVPSVAKAASNDELYRQLLLQLVTTLQQRLELLLQERALMIEGDSDEQQEGLLTSSVDILYRYDVSSPSVVQTISDPVHRAYFTEVFDIFPEEYASELKQVLVFDGSQTEYDAFVETLPPKHETWSYAVSDEVLNEVGTTANLELVVHELAHIISYQPALGVPQPANIHCHEYFKERGCLAGNMYLDAFVDEFWSSSDLYRALRFSEEKVPGDAAYEYYKSHVNDYVSDYAALDPEEDFAESFMFYVLDYDTKGKIADKKLSFFDAYADLRELKNEID